MRIHLYIAVFICLIFGVHAHAQEIQKWVDPESAYKVGIDFINFENYVEARSAFEDYLDKTREDADNLIINQRLNARYFIALAALETGSPDAEVLFLNFIEYSHETTYRRVAYYHIGRMYFEDKKYREAIKWFEQVNQNDLSNEQIIEYRFKLGYSYFLKKDFQEAKGLFKDLLSIKEKYYYPSNYYYGLIAYYEADYESALKHFLIADESEMYVAIVPYYLAQTYFQLGDYEETIEYGEDLAAEDAFKYKKEINQVVGQSYFELGDYNKAIEYLEAYVDMAGRVSKEELYQLAYAQYKTGQYSAAIESFKEFTVVKDALGQNALFALADCYLQTGQKDLARTAFQSAASYNYDAAIVESSTFNYGKLSYELSYHNASITTLESFLKNYPNSKYRAEAEELLSEALLTSKNYVKALEVIEGLETKSNRIKATYQKVAYYRALELFADRKNQGAIDLLNKSLSYPIDKNTEALSYFLRAECRYRTQKYESAVTDYNAFLQLANINKINDANASPFKAYYGLGYCYFKLNNYQQAIGHFQSMQQEYKASSMASEELMYADGSLRAGDCYFMIKNYDEAVAAYDEVINRKGSGKDYALLQKGLVLGLQKAYQNKLTTLNRLLADYPESVYADNAMFEIGRTYRDLENNQNAISTFQRLIDGYPNSGYRPKAMIQTAVIYYRMGQSQQAIDWFDKVVDTYPNSDASKEALTGIKEIYFEQGNPTAFYDYLDNQDGVSYSPSEKDSVLYLAAYEKYQLGKREEALTDFNNYIGSFPNGFFILPAHFYRAEIRYSKEDYAKALEDYEWVINNGISRFSETAYQKAARIHFSNENYEQANLYYNQFYNKASTVRNSFEAEVGLMRTSYFLERYTEAITYADAVFRHEEKPVDVNLEAHFYKGRAGYELASYSMALTELKEVIKGSTGVRGAEAQYYIAQILYEQEKFQESLDACFELTDKFASYEYWVVKAFILMADNYVGLDNLFQAKATLESILKNYEGDQSLIDEAQEKYDAILVMEEENSRIVPENNLIPEDTIITIDPNE